MAIEVIMRWDIRTDVPQNSFDYFEKTQITDNGFREYDVRWLLGKEVNPNGFVVLGKAYGTMMRERYGETRVVVGHDFRAYSQELGRSLTVGLLSAGMHVIDIGLALTPILYFSQHHFNARAGAMVTASHNENGWCGLKLASGLSSTLGPEGILQFKETVKGGKFHSGPGTYESFDGIFDYYLKDLLAAGTLARKLKVVVAAGNGTAGRFAPPLLRALGCEVVELDCEADWNFSRHNPNPEDVAFLHSISKTTVENRADIGIGIDGDGDRIGVVDDRGREIFSDKLGLLLARDMCRREPGRAVVIDVKSTGLYYDDPVIRETGTQVITWKTGHSYIKAKVAESGAFAGFEKSGHWFFNKPFGRGYDDALLSSAHLLRFLTGGGAAALGAGGCAAQDVAIADAGGLLRRQRQVPGRGAGDRTLPPRPRERSEDRRAAHQGPGDGERRAVRPGGRQLGAGAGVVEQAFAGGGGGSAPVAGRAVRHHGAHPGAAGGDGAGGGVRPADAAAGRGCSAAEAQRERCAH